MSALSFLAAAPQTALASDAAESGLIHGLMTLFFWVTLAVYVFVICYLALALRKGWAHRRAEGGLQGEPEENAELGWRIGLTAFAGVTALILLGLSVATWLTDRSIAMAAGTPALEVEVIGHQWWWEVRYHDPIAAREVRSANELVLPDDRPVHIALSSQDVIHSLWIPNLAGKQDLIPGRSSDLLLSGQKAGEYRAQCAEFCGVQHAQMALDVSVKRGSEFNAWYESQLVPPRAPGSRSAQAGMVLFQTRQCASCHTVANTPASGQVAPDLSKVAARKTIAAGALVNAPHNLRRWIADPQAVKPGTTMPKVPLTRTELDVVVAYMETLK